MSFTPTYHCNGCGVAKKDANHWLAIKRHGDRPTIFHVIDIRAFSDAGVDDEHYCGEQCLMKAVSEFVNSLRERQDELLAEPLNADEPVMDAEFREVDDPVVEPRHRVVVCGGANTCSKCGWPIVQNPNTGCHEVIAGSGWVRCFDDVRLQRGRDA